MAAWGGYAITLAMASAEMGSTSIVAVVNEYFAVSILNFVLSWHAPFLELLAADCVSEKRSALGGRKRF
jgi:hypothetical protein